MNEWWDGDEEVLGRMLGMLAAWDGETRDRLGGGGASSPNSLPPSPASSSPDSATTVGTADTSSSQRCRHNVSRKRRQQELQFLRNKVDDMQRQLHELRARRDAMLEPHFCDAQLATVVPVWENLATRQIRARRNSELRNSELKRMLQAQVRVAEDLMRIIHHAEQRASNPTIASSLALGLPGDVSQQTSEEDQLKRLDVLCATWASEFARCKKFASGTGIDSRALWFLDTRVVKDSANETVIELSSRSVLPYPVARVEEAMWKILQDERGLSEAGETFTQTATETDDLIFAVFSATATLDNNLRGAMHGKSRGDFVQARPRSYW